MARFSGIQTDFPEQALESVHLFYLLQLLRHRMKLERMAFPAAICRRGLMYAPEQ